MPLGHRSRGMARFMKQLAGDLDAAAGLPVPSSRPDDLLRLARASAEGNPEAAATLIVHLGGPVLAVVRKVLGAQHPDTDDVAQDAVIAVLGTVEIFRGECTLV